MHLTRIFPGLSWPTWSGTTGLVASLLLGQVALLGIAWLLVYPRMQARRDESQARATSRQVISAFWYRTVDMDALCYDWATWDDMARAVHHWTASFADNNLPPSICNEFDLDLVLVLNREGHIVFARTAPAIDKTGASPQNSLARRVTTMVNRNGPVLKRALVVDDRPCVMVSMPIRFQDESFDHAEPEGTLVMLRILSKEDEDQLSVLLQRKVAIHVIPGEHSDGRPGTSSTDTAPGSTLPFFETGTQTLTVRSPIPALPQGARIVLEVKEPRTASLLTVPAALVLGAAMLLINLVTIFLLIRIRRQRTRRLRFMLRIVDRISRRLFIPPRSIAASDDIALLHGHLDNLFLNIQRMQREKELMHGRDVIREKLVALGRVAAELSHEILTPIRVIRNCLPPLHRKLAGDSGSDRDRRMLHMIDRELDQVESMAENLLRYFREDRIEGLPVQISGVLTAAVERYRQTDSDLIIELDLHADGTVFCSSYQLEQVILNLLKNAREAGATRVHIASETDAERARIHLQDNGPGIPDSIKDRIFEPFFTHKQHRGVGLGLNISYNILRSYHGDLYLSRSEPNQGAHFVLELPMMSEGNG